MKIEDGTGSGGYGLRIASDNRALVSAVSADVRQHNSMRGGAFNINTDDVTITSDAANALLYFKNDESPVNGESRIYIKDIAIGIGHSNGATLTHPAKIKIIRNPTAGTIISDANAAAMNSNNNFGSSLTLGSTTLAYSASGTGKTFTDGTDHALLYSSESTTLGVGNRLFATVDITLERGSAIGITYDPGHTTSHIVYAALLLYKINGELEVAS